jgi:hypothetical protein
MNDQQLGNGQTTIDYEQQLRAIEKQLAVAGTAPEMEAPAPVISETLVERAPAQMPAIVRSMHHTAAQALDDAAQHLEHEMQSHIALMREEAERLRIQGDSQALTIEALSTLIRDTHNSFKQQADKLARFRSGQPE